VSFDFVKLNLLAV